MDRAGKAFEAAVRRLAPDVRACVLLPGDVVDVGPGTVTVGR